ncbi:hypothetical protein ATY75_31505 [Rhizobium sp. N122]|nr:hypothetical protein ATY75_31505 [Rhizobium sp. N122]
MTTVDHDLLIATLDRLKLTAIRDQLDTLLDEAARSKMTLRAATGSNATQDEGFAFPPVAHTAPLGVFKTAEALIAAG